MHECKRLTMEERHRAWREIILDMPDCAMGERRGLKRIDSFHAFLNDFIAMKEQHMSEFMDNTGCIYSFDYCLKDTPPWDDGGAINDFFSSAQTCIEFYQQYLKEYEVDESSIDEILIIKYRLDPPEPVIIHRAGCLRLNAALEIKNVYMFHKHDEDLAEAFDGMCFDFPTPFWRGDILVDQGWREPFVLSHITTWNSEEMLSSGFSEDDCPDPEGWEHFDQAAEQILKDGSKCEGHAIGTTVGDDDGSFGGYCLVSIPTNLEYFREPLEGVARQLKVFSFYEKGKLDGKELADFCSNIRLNEYTKKVCRIYTDGHRYTGEFLKSIGLRPQK